MGLFDRLFGKKKHQVSRLTSVSVKSNAMDGVMPSVISKEDGCLSGVSVGEVLLIDEFAEGLVICYVVDGEGERELVSNVLLREVDITEEEVRKIAYHNLIKRFKTHKQIGVVEFDDTSLNYLEVHTLTFDDDFNTSVLLMDEFWDITAINEIKGRTVAVIVPTVGTCMFIPVQSLNALRTFKSLAESVYESAAASNSEVSDNVYVRKNNEWVKFLDTEEQYCELFDGKVE